MTPLSDNTSESSATYDSNEKMLHELLRETFDYFLVEVDPHTGLIADKTQPGAPSSIAVVGMGLSAYIAGVEERLITRAEAVARTLRILRFFYQSHQGPEPDATGYKGFYYHFLDMKTGKRANMSELSTIDTTFLIAGALSAAGFFTKDADDEQEIRDLADKLYRRVDWQWAQNGATSIGHGWRPESGFIQYHWDCRYSEAMLLYVLALASPEYPVKPESYTAWTDTFECKTHYGTTYIYAGPLFIHQFSHMWIDFRGINDALNRKLGFDYFENSHRATCIQRAYAIENPNNFSHYGPNNWGFTASDGPGDTTLDINGRVITFYDYIARGIPYGPDDGTVAPWAVVASLPFAPEVVIDTIRHAIDTLKLKHHRLYGFDASFNPTYPEKTTNANGWVSPWRFGLNQGPIIMMIGNYKKGTIWKAMKKIPYIQTGLRRAGFEGGWLDEHKGK